MQLASLIFSIFLSLAFTVRLRTSQPVKQDVQVADHSWLDWDQLEGDQDNFCFFKKMIAFRKSHPSLWSQQILA